MQYILLIYNISGRRVLGSYLDIMMPKRWRRDYLDVLPFDGSAQRLFMVPVEPVRRCGMSKGATATWLRKMYYPETNKIIHFVPEHRIPNSARLDHVIKMTGYLNNVLKLATTPSDESRGG